MKVYQLKIKKEQSFIMASEDGFSAGQADVFFIAGNDDGYIYITVDSITVGDATNDYSFTVKGEVVATETTATVVNTKKDDFISIDFTTGVVLASDGDFTFIAISAQGMGQTVSGSTTVTDDGTFVATGSDGDVIAANQEGFVVITDTYITLGSALGTYTVEGKVKFNKDDSVSVEDKKTGEYIELDVDGTATIGSDAGELVVTPAGPEDFSKYDVTFIPAGSGKHKCATVGEILCSLGKDFSFLCSLYEQEEDDDTTYTIFAPPDEAFERIAGPVETLSDEQVGEVFFFHFVEGAVMFDDLQCKARTEMVAGGDSRTMCNDDNNGNAWKVQKGGGNRKNNLDPIIMLADIEACNGSIIHIVSEVLLPNFIPEF
jgi:hypothetical protein